MEVKIIKMRIKNLEDKIKADRERMNEGNLRHNMHIVGNILFFEEMLGNYETLLYNVENLGANLKDEIEALKNRLVRANFNNSTCMGENYKSIMEMKSIQELIYDLEREL